jgi:mono/diheme cytochrome c family protein
VRNNFIINNSRPEKKLDTQTNPPEADEGIDVGVGLRVVAADDTIVEGNVIRDNPSAAILVMDHHAALRFIVPDPKEDPYPDRNAFVRNMFVGNGAQPVGYLKTVLAETGHKQAPDVLVLGRGTGNCVDSLQAVFILGDVDWKSCPEVTSANVHTKRLAEPVKGPDLTLAQRGRLTYLAVCSGCHSFNNRIYGPPMVAARASYMGDPQKLAAWIANPTKKRADYPPMPPQSYLPDDVRFEVARYVLQDLKQ